jgi:hypothetical protein
VQCYLQLLPDLMRTSMSWVLGPTCTGTSSPSFMRSAHHLPSALPRSTSASRIHWKVQCQVV